MAIDEFFDGKYTYLRVRVMVDGVMQPRAHIPISENGVPLSPEKLSKARKS